MQEIAFRESEETSTERFWYLNDERTRIFWCATFRQNPYNFLKIDPSSDARILRKTSFSYNRLYSAHHYRARITTEITLFLGISLSYCTFFSAVVLLSAWATGPTSATVAFWTVCGVTFAAIFSTASDRTRSLPRLWWPCFRPSTACCAIKTLKRITEINPNNFMIKAWCLSLDKELNFNLFPSDSIQWRRCALKRDFVITSYPKIDLFSTLSIVQYSERKISKQVIFSSSFSITSLPSNFFGTNKAMICRRSPSK